MRDDILCVCVQYINSVQVQVFYRSRNQNSPGNEDDEANQIQEPRRDEYYAREKVKRFFSDISTMTCQGDDRAEAQNGETEKGKSRRFPRVLLDHIQNVTGIKVVVRLRVGYELAFIRNVEIQNVFPPFLRRIAAFD